MTLRDEGRIRAAMDNMSPGERARCEVMIDVQTERLRQDAKWGEQNHDPTMWMTILAEEVGELAEAMLEERAFRLVGEIVGDPPNSVDWPAAMRLEAVHVAAVAFALIECLDRGVWLHGPSPSGEAP